MNKTVLAFFVAIIPAVMLFTASPYAQAETETRISSGVFQDKTRSRDIPYKLYEPAQPAAGALPVVIFSHGLGGSVEAAPYLGQALAENGYLAFFIQHPGSDKSVWEEQGRVHRVDALKKSLLDRDNSTGRYGDIPFVIDELARLNQQEGALKGRIDLDKIGMAGHSYGARGTMTAAGEADFTGKTPFKEPRIKAGVVLSPNIARRHRDKTTAELANQYKNISIPLFHMTGTKDGDPLTATGKTFDPITRTLPYQAITTADQYLLVLDGAEHKTFGGGKTAGYAAHQKAVAKGAVLFFDAYLKDDGSALKTLRSDYKRGLAPGDRFEYKTVNR